MSFGSSGYRSMLSHCRSWQTFRTFSRLLTPPSRQTPPVPINIASTWTYNADETRILKEMLLYYFVPTSIQFRFLTARPNRPRLDSPSLSSFQIRNERTKKKLLFLFFQPINPEKGSQKSNGNKQEREKENQPFFSLSESSRMI